MLLLLLMSFMNAGHLFAEEEFMAPTESMLAAVNLETFFYATKVAKEGVKKPCPQKSPELKLDLPESSPKKVRCLCELEKPLPSDGPDASFPLIGKLQSYTYRIDSGNDNFLHGLLMLVPSLKKYDGDDTGRTFGLTRRQTLVGEKGRFSVETESTLFSQTQSHLENVWVPNPRFPGYGNWGVQSTAYNSEGNMDLKTMERNSVRFKFDLTDSESKKEDVYSRSSHIVEVDFDNYTDDGIFSKFLQKTWHHMSQVSIAPRTVQYEYWTEGQNIDSLKFLIGHSNEDTRWLSHFKCASKAQAAVGASVQFDDHSGAILSRNGEASAKVETTLSHSHLPWLAINLWLSGAKGYEGTSNERGLEISYKRDKESGITIRPFIGITQHKTDLDKKWGGTPSGLYPDRAAAPYENYHSMGVEITWD